MDGLVKWFFKIFSILMLLFGVALCAMKDYFVGVMSIVFGLFFGFIEIILFEKKTNWDITKFLQKFTVDLDAYAWELPQNSEDNTVQYIGTLLGVIFTFFGLGILTVSMLVGCIFVLIGLGVIYYSWKDYKNIAKIFVSDNFSITRIVVLFGMFWLAFSILLSAPNLYVMAVGETVTGRIDSFYNTIETGSSRSYSASGKTSYGMINVSYEIDGKTYSARLNEGASYYRSGQLLMLAYLPKNPYRVYNCDPIGMFPLFLGGIVGSIALMYGVYIILHEIKSMVQKQNYYEAGNDLFE